MTTLVQERREAGKCASPKAVILREEFVALTQEPLVAIVLNQLLYWTQRVKDFDLFLKEEQFFNPECKVLPRHGWIYKSANDLIEETMICVDRTTMRRYLKTLMNRGWLEERSHPKNRWEKTIQYRLNIRKLQKDLLALGFELPGIELLLKEEFVHHNESQDEELDSDLSEAAETLEGDFAPMSGHFAPSKGQNISHSQKSAENSRVQNAPSNGQDALSKEKIAPSNVTNCPLYIQRLQSENKNRDHTQEARVCEESYLKNFSDVENPESPVSEAPVSESPGAGLSEKNETADRTPKFEDSEGDDPEVEGSELEGSAGNEEAGTEKAEAYESVAQEMVNLWEYHILQKLDPSHWKGRIHLTEARESQLESIFAFHFRNDIKAWERFCIQSKSTPFLMGESPSGWHVTLDWILSSPNLSKILEGNYNRRHLMDTEEGYEGGFHEESSNESGFDRSGSLGSGLSQSQVTSSLNAQKDAILASIKDPIWREWCTKLSQGVRLNALQMTHEPLSLAELSQIANASFLECEDERLVWIGSSDQAVLNAIEKVRLKINWVFADCYPKAHTIRTRLLKKNFPFEQNSTQAPSSSTHPTSLQGENHHA